jgi:hypothetical protein
MTTLIAINKSPIAKPPHRCLQRNRHRPFVIASRKHIRFAGEISHTNELKPVHYEPLKGAPIRSASSWAAAAWSPTVDS